jgi:hypothetical protein
VTRELRGNRNEPEEDRGFLRCLEAEVSHSDDDMTDLDAAEGGASRRRSELDGPDEGKLRSFTYFCVLRKLSWRRRAAAGWWW